VINIIIKYDIRQEGVKKIKKKQKYRVVHRNHYWQQKNLLSPVVFFVDHPVCLLAIIHRRPRLQFTSISIQNLLIFLETSIYRSKVST